MLRTARWRVVMALSLMVSVLTVLPTVGATAVTGDLLISEYIEGSSFNKAIEIYNGTGGAVDLSAYDLELYSNGSPTPSQTSTLSGSLADGDVYVLANPSADAAILAVADVTDGAVINFNGDDAVVLRATGGGAIVDAFGQVGVDPGSEWTGGGQDDTLQRLPSICAGDTNAGDAFDASAEFAVLAQDTFDGLGAHTANCNGGEGPAVLVISEVMFNPASAEDDWEWIEIANTGGTDADLAGWVIDDINSVAHVAANIAAGTVPAGGSAILFNVEDVPAADFAAAWGTGMNLVEVTSWGAMGLNNGGDTIGLWSDFASYSGDEAIHANAVLSQTYADIDDGNASVYLSDLADTASWTLSADGVATPVGTAYGSADAGGNVGGEIGSPGGTLDGGGGDPEAADHLLLTEFAVTPTASEFVEIHNPTADAVDLSDVYLTDAFFGGGDFYWNVVTGDVSISGGGAFGDWHARFPDGASIGAGEYQTVALAGSDAFVAAYGVDPTYELGEDGDGTDTIPEMREALPTSINFADGPGLSNAGESLVLYEWDGLSDLVQDIDYIVWGDKAEAIDKTGITIDGPDADTDTSAYVPDTSVGFQEALADGHDDGVSFQRRDLSEGSETKDGGNGVTGNDETSENVTVTWGETAPNPNAATTLPPPDTGGGPGPLPEPGVCGDPFTSIPTIQGTGDASLLDEQALITEGVVTSILGGLGGFTIQDPVGDGVASSSDGIFVFADSTGLAVGDAVRVVGHVDEFFDLTEITSLTDEDVIVLSCGTGAAIAPTPVSLPVAESLEPYEGMLVAFDDVFVTDTFDLIQFGQFGVSGPDRLFIPTDLVDPGGPYVTLFDQNNRSRFVIDDGSTSSNPSPIPFLENGDGSFNVIRLGDRVVAPSGVLYYGFGDYQLIPDSDVVFDGAGRPDVPDVGGDVKVASLNVLNYFTTLNERGANTTEEFERQEAKLVAAVQGLGAAIVGLQEIENNGPVAIGALVDALNAAAAPGETWAYVDDPEYPGGLESTNAIKVGIIYRSDLVATNGDPSFTSLDEDFSFDRPPVGQTFVAGGEVFTVIVNHFKSKGCSGTDPGDEFEAEADIGDGQACYAPRRTRMAEALLVLVAETQAATGDPDVLVIGDLNSYAQEDPVDVLRAGLVDLTGSQSANERRSFVFFGEAGQLDYAFATPELAAKVTGAAHWHINADELRNLDYNTEFNPPALYNVDPYRSSDHDPLLVGIGDAQLAPRQAILAVAAELAELPPTGRFWDDWRIGRAVDRLERAASDDLWIGDTHVIRERPYNDVISAIRLLERLRSVDPDPYVDDLVAALAAVTGTAIDDAVNADGIAWLIAAAQFYQGRADTNAASGDAVQAVRDYRRAWTRAANSVRRPRVSTFNSSLNRGAAGELVADLLSGADVQAQTIAEIIQVNRPNVVLINEFDYDSGGLAADLFRSNYLEVGQNGQDPIVYPYAYVAESNTGIDSGFDLNNDGVTGTADDAFGFGNYPGQYGMLVLSQHPLDLDEVRTFQKFLWKDMPDALLPDDLETPEPADWYSPDELDVFRLSSKSHWDVPVAVGRNVFHFLVSHPTPPVFDGDEDRNGRRNHDEIRFWADYVDPGASGYIYDDNGGVGGLADGARFVIAGDQNSDPFDGDSIPGSAQLLLESPYVNTAVTPSSEGGTEQALLQGGVNDDHIGNPAFDTADFSDSSSGNLRADYVLPSYNIWIRGAGVFWPLEADPLFPLVGTFPFPSSDHRLVWVDVSL